jgi:hypothetical protein
LERFVAVVVDGLDGDLAGLWFGKGNRLSPVQRLPGFGVDFGS